MEVQLVSGEHCLSDLGHGVVGDLVDVEPAREQVGLRVKRNRCAASLVAVWWPSGSASTIFRIADASAEPSPKICSARPEPAVRRARASSWFRPVSSVRNPGSKE
ncbi:hypothetical protein GCM10010197_10430 [Nocardioides luteus]|uniref:Uncharacterized protein n=1 Tax=Nocardioides luteus TaxID=1844 RepID=A0ABQ5SXJ4_9ACTN|nr:hypothetical protein GCM10010197_10430 [Nocardioides luteus]GLJ68907.1 hypothetical protein GCM10017579_29430 [Nocardioides luteus]